MADLVGSGQHARAQRRSSLTTRLAPRVNDLRTKARRLYAEHGLDLIIIDYMQLMTGSAGSNGRNENRQQEISYISRSLKSLARELNVPVIALSQLIACCGSAFRQAPHALRPARVG